ncbi:MAG: 5-formyltetrahydrofolate cyclo-ligase [Desulfovibrionaceae bacterium]|nr:5-formyltetrahydrofolate cyclo-ligase [Desulfovibrionaceae bacterium]
MDINKADLRRRFLQRRLALDRGEVEAQSRAACDCVRGLAEWRAARRVLAYWPTKNEIDVRPLVRELWDRGLAVLLPRCLRDRPGRLELAWAGSESDLRPGPYSILAPGPACPCAQEGPDQVRPELVLVPGLAFDPRGFRLGFGGGYYDRLLAEPWMQGAFTVGLCYAFQVVEELPVDPWDRPVDALCPGGPWSG